MEAQNYAGAARLLRERNPFAEVCGYTCPVDQFCQGRCHRRSFASEPVRIADLERWVCEAAGPAGWHRKGGAGKGWKIAVIGANAAGLSCAYYLALSGCSVDVYDEVAQPDDRLAHALDGEVPRASLVRDVNGILLQGIRFQGGQKLGRDFTEDLRRSHDAVVVGAGSLGISQSEAVAPTAVQAAALPGITLLGNSMSGRTVVEAAAEGRRAAVAIVYDLDTRRKQPQE
jgi:NADPH-dependent glutamate synthase beta subunit-like oxidoreductase